MAHDIETLERIDEPLVEAVERPSRLVDAWRAGIALGVCLLVWTVLAAPMLERNASAGPVGARRTAALSALRPFLAMSQRLGLDAAAGSLERVLGRNPDAPPGGVLELPDFELPPEAYEPTPVFPPPSTTGPEPSTSPGGGRDDDEGEGREGGDGSKISEEPIGLREPTSSNRLRVAVIGDSLSQGLGPAIEQWMNPNVVRVLSLGRQSTGLSRQDYFNWQSGMRQIVEEFRPDLVFILLGSNDAQAQISADGTAIPVGSVAWIQGYRDEATQLLSEATTAGTRVVWIGMPIVEQHNRWDFYRRVNEIYRDTAQADPLSTYLDAWDLFRANDGGYRAFVRNERGILQEMRAPDGLHLSPTGYAYLGRTALRRAAEEFGLSQRAVTFRL